MRDIEEAAFLELPAPHGRPVLRDLAADGAFDHLQDVAKEKGLIRRIAALGRVDDPIGASDFQDIDRVARERVEKPSSGLAVATAATSNGLVILLENLVVRAIWG